MIGVSDDCLRALDCVSGVPGEMEKRGKLGDVCDAADMSMKACVGQRG